MLCWQAHQEVIALVRQVAVPSLEKHFAKPWIILYLLDGQLGQGMDAIHAPLPEHLMDSARAFELVVTCGIRRRWQEQITCIGNGCFKCIVTCNAAPTYNHYKHTAPDRIKVSLLMSPRPPFRSIASNALML